MGEDLIWEVYDTIFINEKYKDNTLLIITYDEHGECYDHVPPVAAIPPNEGGVGFDTYRMSCAYGNSVFSYINGYYR